MGRMKDLLVDDFGMLIDVADETGYDEEELFNMAWERVDKYCENKDLYEEIDIVHKACMDVAEEVYQAYLIKDILEKLAIIEGWCKNGRKNNITN